NVDKECISQLEESMFEHSSQAGITVGWGLDAGDHQVGWDPYEGTPFIWNHEDWEGSE
ncbi:hypothetical protein AMATHDRAFT_130640, partial [Amanita thiersii Skay4041]